jgi:hypothetical protein
VTLAGASDFCQRARPRRPAESRTAWLRAALQAAGVPPAAGPGGRCSAYTWAASRPNSAIPPLNRKPTFWVRPMAMSRRCGSLNHVVPYPPNQP